MVFLSTGGKMDETLTTVIKYFNDGHSEAICMDEEDQQTDTYYGVLDRIEDGNNAVILIEDIEQEVIMPVGNLPDGSKEGVWFSIEFDEKNHKYIIVDIDHERTKKQLEKSIRLLKKLQQPLQLSD